MLFYKTSLTWPLIMIAITLYLITAVMLSQETISNDYDNLTLQFEEFKDRLRQCDEYFFN